MPDEPEPPVLPEDEGVDGVEEGVEDAAVLDELSEDEEELEELEEPEDEPTVEEEPERLSVR